MRIAYVTSRFPKLSETFIANEAAALRDAGVDVRVFAYVEDRSDTRHPAAAALAAVACYPTRARVLRDQLHWLTRAPGRYIRAWRRAIVGNIASPRFVLRALVVVPVAASFARTMRDDGVDHVHAHYATHSALGAYVVHLLTGIPYSFTAHAHDIQVDRTMLAEKVRSAAFVAVVSELNGDVIVNEVGEDVRARIHVVRCGVDPRRFQPRTAAVGDPFAIAIVASLERRKGHRLLFEAVRDLLDRGHHIVVDVVGDGPDARSVEHDLERLELRPHVRLHGPLPAPAVADVLRASDAFVLPSVTEPSGKMEGIPVALMEAMAVGLPVVATRMSGTPELVIHEETGLLISEGSVDELTRSIEALVQSVELRRRLGATARAHVGREFDERLNVDRLLALFRSSVRPDDRAPIGPHEPVPTAITHAVQQPQEART